MTVHPWDRREGESEADYAKFMAYLSLGPTRTINTAYRSFVGVVAGPDKTGRRSKYPPGSWLALSSRWEWVERTAAWDTHNLRAAALRIAKLWVAGVEVLARKAFRSAKQYNPGDKPWAAVLDTFKVVSANLSFEAIQGACASETYSPISVHERIEQLTEKFARAADYVCQPPLSASSEE
jgi:hypothetical protein